MDNKPKYKNHKISELEEEMILGQNIICNNKNCKKHSGKTIGSLFIKKILTQSDIYLIRANIFCLFPEGNVIDLSNKSINKEKLRILAESDKSRNYSVVLRNPEISIGGKKLIDECYVFSITDLLLDISFVSSRFKNIYLFRQSEPEIKIFIDEGQKKQKETAHKLIREFRRVAEDIQKSIIVDNNNGKIDINPEVMKPAFEISKRFRPIHAAWKGRPELLEFYNDAPDQFFATEYNHSCSVARTISAILLNYPLFKEESEQALLSGFFIDAGLSVMKQKQLNNGIRYKQNDILKEHCESGALLLRKAIDSYINEKKIAGQSAGEDYIESGLVNKKLSSGINNIKYHHESLNGKGPFGCDVNYGWMRQNKIFPIVDSFYRNISKWDFHHVDPTTGKLSVVEQEAMTRKEAIRYLIDHPEFFDRDWVEVFKENIAVYPRKAIVKLSNGTTGFVVHLNPHALESPEVYIIEERRRVSLVEERSITITDEIKANRITYSKEEQYDINHFWNPKRSEITFILGSEYKKNEFPRICRVDNCGETLSFPEDFEKPFKLGTCFMQPEWYGISQCKNNHLYYYSIQTPDNCDLFCDEGRNCCRDFSLFIESFIYENIGE